MTDVADEGLPIKGLAGSESQLHPDGTGDEHEEESGGMRYGKFVRL